MHKQTITIRLKKRGGDTAVESTSHVWKKFGGYVSFSRSGIAWIEANALDRCQGVFTNHRELLEILLKRRRLRLVHEVTVLVDALRRQVRWTWMTRRAGRRRWIVAVAQRAPLRPIDSKERIIFHIRR